MDFILTRFSLHYQDLTIFKVKCLMNMYFDFNLKSQFLLNIIVLVTLENSCQIQGEYRLLPAQELLYVLLHIKLGNLLRLRTESPTAAS